MDTNRSRTPLLRGEQGVALPVALLGLVAVTILITGALVISSTSTAISSAQQDGKQSLYAAEAALEGYIQSRVDGTGMSTLAETPVPVVENVANAGQARITVARLGQFFATPTDRLGTRFYSVMAEPVRPSGEVLGRSVVSIVPIPVRRVLMNLNITGAATLGSRDVTIQGSSFISGKQNSLLCNTGSDVKAVTLASDATNVRIGANNIDGGLSQVENSGLTGAQLASRVLDSEVPRNLAKFANIKYGFDGKPAWTDQDPTSTLPRSNPLNWGCPWKLLDVFNPGGRCTQDGDQSYFPVVAIDAGTGAAKINQGHGQGLLIVLGDLDITGKFYFSGVVIVTGQTFIRGSGGESRIDGALIGLGNVIVDPSTGGGSSAESSTVTGNAKIFYNSCSVDAAEAAFNAASAQSPIQQARTARSQGWMEVVR